MADASVHHCQWGIEGDIKGCFDNLDHYQMMKRVPWLMTQAPVATPGIEQSRRRPVRSNPLRIEIPMPCCSDLSHHPSHATDQHVSQTNDDFRVIAKVRS
jgi:hypothetical protein